MSISLSSLKKPTKRPMIATIVGEGGIGKTTLASYFPNSVIIPTEDGTQSIQGREDVAVFPLAKKSQDVLDMIQALTVEDHDRKTLIIDSITQLNTMIEHEIVAADPKAKSINTAMGGYGAGQSAVSEVHARIRQAVEDLRNKKNMYVIFIAHADSETIDPPDGDPYTRYTIRMHKKSVAHYSDNVDLVAYLKLEVFTTDKKKAVKGGEDRIIVCYPTPANISKNRFGIDKDLKWNIGDFPFKEYLV